MNNWTRRRFIRVVTLGGVGALAAACGAPTDTQTPAVGETPGETATSAPTQAPTQASPTSAPGRPLTNENRPDVKPDWNVRYFQAYQPVDPAQWQLTVDGLVEAPQAFSLEDLRELERIEQDTRMKCVECWSARATWAGFSYAALAEVVRPQPEAAWVTFQCADGYYESLSIEELGQPRVMFAYDMDGEPLLAEFGAPLRMVVPAKYGYKWPKAIVSLSFEVLEERGYWPTVGPYTTEGRVEAGQDFPLDIGETRQIDGGEITEY